ncbi:MAG: DNA polymerase III subunit gamma and tau [Actinomycetes bacterium]
MPTALYRRYRPETFVEVIGQEHVTDPLRQALRSDRVHHAYLFSGPRGCGKTTSARILARCLNCVKGPTDTPCGVCDSCVELARVGAGSLDVVEIDAASHGGVDDARELRERATFAPARDRYKIYIIDEAHMVSNAGFNALLKIVEEPPEHVRFIFATTEPDKVIGTIRSRTHHYPFHLVPPERLLAYLEELCAREQVEVGKGVLPLVVRAGGGSVRDSLSVLDQLVAGAEDGRVEYQRAISLLGYTDAALLDDVVGAVAVGDGATVFGVVDRVVESGHDPRRFVEDLLERFRDLIVLQAIGEGGRSVFRALPEDQLARMRQQADAFRPATLSRAADLANAALSEMTGATSPRLHLELLCARILLPGAEHTERGLAARLDRLERRLSVSLPVDAPMTPAVSAPAAPAAPAAAPRAEPAAPPPSPAPPPRERPADRPEPPRQQPPPVREQAPPPERSAVPEPAGAANVEAVRRMWPDVLNRLMELKKTTWSTATHSQVVGLQDGVLRLGFTNSGALRVFARGAHAEFVRQALLDVLGLDVRIEPVPLAGDAAAPTAPESRATPAREPASEPEPVPEPDGWEPAPPPVADEPPSGEEPETVAAPAPPRRAPVAPEDDTWSRDDEDAEDSGMVGPRVVEEMLGGRVIDVRDSP